MDDARKPYPLSWEEQQLLFDALPEHLRDMALFKVNTGCREQEVCQRQWDWEVNIPELGTSVFLIPSYLVKNRDERLVVLNTIAKSVIEKVRGVHPTYVFVYRDKRLTLHFAIIASVSDVVLQHAARLNIYINSALDCHDPQTAGVSQ